MAPWQAARWLVSSADPSSEAHAEWARGRPALLRVGRRFDAIRLRANVVHAYAGQDDGEAPPRADVERALAGAGITTAVIADPARHWYYALVPPGTAAGWTVRGIECLGPNHFLGVPAPHRVDPPGSYWLLAAPDSNSTLCDPGAVHELIRVQRTSAEVG
ncbi:hypothetical protein ACH4U6_08160 [Streptomyces netropsis]|uniref:hypothetical protein n=1 Tax=Streptomyces netropsis TaxID=55404 RepID=UPI003798045F